ncbi:hypothetical protein [Neobacillus massiliamazoniensis]|uniref:hypothetical protein n=1 Tax=Neobacillus massiliamazoniensis TaxID=1499688 RepID=UPI000A5BC761|nr:hypothetical protein [Neobacillus massiliamazoniensis]
MAIARKAEAPWSGATGIRRAGVKVGFYLHDGLAYDPEPLGAEARQRKAEAPSEQAQLVPAKSILMSIP